MRGTAYSHITKSQPGKTNHTFLPSRGRGRLGKTQGGTADSQITRSQPGKNHTFLPGRGKGRLGRTRGELQIHKLPDPNPAKTIHFFQAEEGGGLAEHEGNCRFTNYQIPILQKPYISSRQRKGEAWQNTRGTADS